MTFAIRLLTPDDTAALIACTETDWAFEVDPDETKRAESLDLDGAVGFLNDPSVLYWLAQAHGEPIASLHCYVQRRAYGGPWAELLLYSIGVHFEWRSQGVGRALLDEMERWMRQRGVAEVWVPADLEAVDFYAACGFRTDEGVIMVKDITSPA